MIIRPAHSDDAGEMAALIMSFQMRLTVRPDGAGAEEFLKSVSESAIRGYIEAQNFYHLVAEDGSILIGFIAVRDNAHLFHLFVKPSHQSNGLARKLWEAARLHAEAHGNPGLFTVNSSRSARVVYERFGFQQVSPVTERHGVAFIPMRFEPREDDG